MRSAAETKKIYAVARLVFVHQEFLRVRDVIRQAVPKRQPSHARPPLPHCAQRVSGAHGSHAGMVIRRLHSRLDHQRTVKFQDVRILFPKLVSRPVTANNNVLSHLHHLPVRSARLVMPGVYMTLSRTLSRFVPRGSSEKPRLRRRHIFASPKTSARISAMKRRTLLQSLPAAAFLPAATWAASEKDTAGPGQTSTTVYELRVYHTYEGKLDDLLRRFREHTMQLFEKHGIKNVAYWTPPTNRRKARPSSTSSRIPAAKPPPPTGKRSATIPNGKACEISPKPMASWWKRSIPRFSH